MRGTFGAFAPWTGACWIAARPPGAWFAAAGSVGAAGAGADEEEAREEWEEDGEAREEEEEDEVGHGVAERVWVVLTTVQEPALQAVEVELLTNVVGVARAQ